MTSRDKLFEFAQRYLKALIAEAAESVDANFDSATSFGDLGIDSFRVLRIVKALEQDFGRLPKTLLFENFNVNDLAAYFVDRHGSALRAKFEASDLSAAPVPTTAVPALAPAAPASIQGETLATLPAGPVLGFEHTLRADPRIGEWVRKVFNEHKNDGSVSRGTRNIAPNLFVGSQRLGYIHYARSQDRVLGYAYSGPDDHYAELAAEFCRHCMQQGLHPNLLCGQPLPDAGELRFSATPFGVVQRIVELQNFSLAGTAMRRLRYLVNKFEKEGVCRTEEFRCGSDPAVTDAIVALIDAWCANRTMVNPLIHKVRAEVADGTLDPSHRIFATYVDEVMQNVILISPLAARFNGYLMDLEFYGGDMPLGGLEFAISRIIETLVAERCEVFSLGGTYGCKLEESAHADPAIDRALDELREQNLFNDAGNLQFKNKFRPENHTIFLCRPQGTGATEDVIDLIMMIADPDRMQTSDASRHTVPATGDAQLVAAVAPAFVSPADDAAPSSPAGLQGLPRSFDLAESGFNPLSLPHERVDFDLKTDSWAQLHTPAIEQRTRHLHARLAGPVDTEAALKSIFPFSHFTLTQSGRTAERVLYRAQPRKGVVLQNLLFPTNLFHQIDNGFTPKEVPRASVFTLDAAAAAKGELDLDAVRDALADAAGIAMVCVEIANNAAGGQPVAADHLRAIAAMLAPHGLPLVVDATRVLDNVSAGEARHGKAMWEAVRESLECADAIIASLPKNFGVTAGGLIATRDASLHARLQAIAAEEGCGLGAFDRKLLGLALQDRAFLEHRIVQRQAAVARLGAALAQQGLPIVQPVGAHCVLIDVAAIAEFASLSEPVPSFLAWLYLETGVRAAGHNAGLTRHHRLATTVRLAVPLGTPIEDVDEVARRIVLAFADKRNIPDLEARAGGNTGDLAAAYRLRGYIRPGAPIEARSPAQAGAPAESHAAATPVGAVVRGETPASSRPVADIAIVGMAGRYPGANNPRELWRVLVEGRDCVADLPEARLAMRQGAVSPTRYRGGFIDDVDAFDAAFFGIAGRDAAIMDPQERHFLEVAYEALEDAGYHPDTLGGDGGDRNIGVFVGAVWSSYQMIGADEKAAGRHVNPSSFLWSIANRVSYWMDLHGPSLTLDTACSASLTAIKLACDAIRSGECRAALAGGVNFDLHQSKYDINASGGSLSRQGMCRAYGEGADGYVSGEGVAALLLKPLDQAIADGDHVYAVIRSATVTHSGLTSAYTVPNPRTQTDLIARALKQADVDARTIGYVEGHGTGTDLGDTIEIAGLSRAFAAHGVPLGSVPVGSIKTNIGHLEAASGIVGVQKILLQMQHGTLVPSLHAEVPNGNIDFEATPFHIQCEVAPWSSRTIDGRTWPRRASISAIGIGGANAHLILEEFVPDGQNAADDDTAAIGVRIVPLSARTPEQLRQVAERLLACVREGGSRLRLDDIAFTLSQGRRSFGQRVALLAGDLQELVDRLTGFLAGTPDDHVMVGQADNANNVAAMLDAQEREDFVALMVQRGDPRRLARLWADGLIADARRIGPGRGRRISLPTYPFARTRYWIGAVSDASAYTSAGASGTTPALVAAAPTPPVAAQAKQEPVAPSRMRYRFWIEGGGAVGPSHGDLSVDAKAELFVRQMLADCLDVSVDVLRSEHGLLEIGLTSLNMADLTTELKTRFGAKFSPTVFFECRTIGDFSRQLAAQYGAHFEALRFAKHEVAETAFGVASHLPVRAESGIAFGETHVLDAGSPLALPDTPWPQAGELPPSLRILLTGATGFLGIHILHALCAGDEAVRVRCLVRADGADAAWARLRHKASRYGLTLDERRIEIVCGDVCAPQLGLSDAQWDAGCDDIDQIVHAAAHVNHIEGYASFRDATQGMKEIIRLAASRRPKLVQFMSSTAACIQKIDENFVVYEHESFIPSGETVYGGYGQSKWVQETLLKRAAAAGVPYVIYRFGELSGSSRTGHAQTDDMLHRLLQMRLAVGCREKVSSDVLDALPVDIAARLIAGTTREPTLWNAIVHGTHLTPCPIARVYKLAEQRLGRSYVPVTRQSYLAACFEFVLHVYEHSPVDGFVLECVLRDAEGTSRQRKIMDGYFAVLFPFEQTRFSRALETLRVALPAWDRLLATYFDRWCGEDCNYLSLVQRYGAPQDAAALNHPSFVPMPAMVHSVKPALERVNGI